MENFHDTYGVKCCRHCSSMFVSPVPSREALSFYYSECKCNKMLQSLYRKRRGDVIVDPRVHEVGKIVEEYDPREMNILEIGCGSGVFLRSCKEYLTHQFPHKSFTFKGVDIDCNAVASASSDLDLECINIEDDPSSLQKESFDIILHFELIEHLTDPKKFMDKVHTLLRPGGFVLFTTPNIHGAETVVTHYNQERLLAHAIFPPMHLNAFSPGNALLLLHRCNFHLCRLETPGELDADLVSRSAPEGTLVHLVEALESNMKVKEELQELLKMVRGSSHMKILASKPSL